MPTTLGLGARKRFGVNVIIEQQQVVAKGVVLVDVVPQHRRSAAWYGRHLLIEHLEAQPLDPADLLRRCREPDLKAAEPPENWTERTGIARMQRSGSQARTRCRALRLGREATEIVEELTLRPGTPHHRLRPFIVSSSGLVLSGAQRSLLNALAPLGVMMQRACDSVGEFNCATTPARSRREGRIPGRACECPARRNTGCAEAGAGGLAEKGGSPSRTAGSRVVSISFPQSARREARGG